MKWMLKALVQKIISWLPNSQKVNFWFQKNVTKGVLLTDQHFSDKLVSATDHVRYYRKFGGIYPFKCLELGSGWYPVVPIALFLTGAKEIVSIDISPLMNKNGILECIDKYLNWHEEGRLGKLEDQIDHERWKELEALKGFSGSFESLCKKLKLKLKVEDARNTGFPDDSFDLICSNNTYEHIYPAVLTEIISEFHRILKPGGVNSHFIDMSDHFAHLDETISIYHFLRYSDRRWDLIDNSVQPQNRLRKKDYLKIYEQLNISLVHEKDRPGDLKVLQREKLDPHFSRNYSFEELAISHTHLVNSKSVGIVKEARSTAHA